MNRKTALALTALAVLVASPLLAEKKPAEDPNAVIIREVEQAKSIREQADVLLRLAWLEESTDPAVAALARFGLEQYGSNAMLPLRRAFPDIPPRFLPDAVATLIGASQHVSGQTPPDYLPALEEVLWIGTAEAQRLAIPEICRYRYLPGFLPVIDSAYENPQLAKLAAEQIVQFQDDRARHFLEHLLLTGGPDEKRAAAQSLAAIGERARRVLLNAVKSPEPLVRIEAVTALLDIIEPHELIVLQDYVQKHDDDAVSERARAKVVELGGVLELGVSEAP